MRRHLACIALAALVAPAAVRADEAAAWEVRLDAALVRPKAHVRAGAPGLAGSDVYSGPDLDTDGSVPAPALEAVVRCGPSRLSLGGWWVAADGRAALDEPKAFAGFVLPAGTAVDSTLRWTSLRLQYRYAIPLWTEAEDGAGAAPRLAIELGAALDRTAFRAELDSPAGGGAVSLVGLYPTPQVTIEGRPFDFLSVRGVLGGFNFLRIPNGDTTVFDPLEYRIAVRAAWKDFFAEVGYYLYHVHFERDRNAPEEDIVHMRLRSIYAGIGVTF
jgi:hypothetical protein